MAKFKARQGRRAPPFGATLLQEKRGPAAPSCPRSIETIPAGRSGGGALSGLQRGLELPPARETFGDRGFCSHRLRRVERERLRQIILAGDRLRKFVAVEVALAVTHPFRRLAALVPQLHRHRLDRLI